MFGPLAWYPIQYAAIYGVPVSLVRGIMRAEGWNPDRPTWEGNVREHSWGPMQILESTARGEGYVGPAEALHEPRIGIKYGTKYLRSRLRRWDPCDAVSAYNAGRPLSGNAAYVCRAAPFCGGC